MFNFCDPSIEVILMILFVKLDVTHLKEYRLLDPSGDEVRKKKITIIHY